MKKKLKNRYFLNVSLLQLCPLIYGDNSNTSVLNFETGSTYSERRIADVRVRCLCRVMAGIRYGGKSGKQWPFKNIYIPETHLPYPSGLGEYA